MTPGSADLETPCESLKVFPLRRTKRVAPKERDNHLEEIIPTLNVIAVQVLSVVVEAPVDRHRAYPKEALQRLQASSASRALNDGEAVTDLESGPVALTAGPIWLSDEAD